LAHGCDLSQLCPPHLDGGSEPILAAPRPAVQSFITHAPDTYEPFAPARARPSMDWDDYLRQQAAIYRQLGEQTEDAFIKKEFLELAAVCEEIASNIEDRLTGR
jgi:hypothetical protein